MALENEPVDLGNDPGSGDFVPDAPGQSLPTNPAPVLATIAISVTYVPNPLTAAQVITQNGVDYGPFPCAVTGPAADGLTYTLTASLTSIPAGLAAGDVSVQPGDIVGGVFTAASVGGVPVPPSLGTLSLVQPPAPVFPAIPPYLYSVARWRSQVRLLIADEPVTIPDGQTVPLSLLTVLPDSALDEALRESLSAIAEWRPQVYALPPFALVPGQSAYPLPADFGEAVPETWHTLLGPDPWLSGQYPGSRDFFRRRAAMRDSAMPYGISGQYGGGFGYAGLWSGGFYGGDLVDGGYPILPEDANGNIIAGSGFGQQSRVDFYPASYASPSPVMVLTPAPQQARMLMGLTYRALALPQRLTLDGTGLAWTVDALGNLAFTPAYLSEDFVDGTDVLPYGPAAPELRLSLRYASAWLIMQKIMPLAETDDEKFAFYEIKTGLGRKDLQAIADRMMKEFDNGTKKKPHGVRG